MKFLVNINIDEVARAVNRQVSEIRERVVTEVQNLSISTHAFIIAKANAELDDYMRKIFLGKDNKNVRWSRMSASSNIWIVEVDPSVAWIEEDRGPQFMKWLLEKNPKAKRAKDGSLYAHIPITQSRLAGSDPDRHTSPKAAYEAIIKKTLQNSGISLKRIERNTDGTPKIGVLHKVGIDAPGSQSQFPSMFGTPRSQDIANKIGLQAYGGDYHLKGLAIIQRFNKKGKPVREAVTIRTISSKHESEGLGRWTQKAKKGLHSIEAAKKYADESWLQIVEMLKREYR